MCTLAPWQRLLTLTAPALLAPSAVAQEEAVPFRVPAFCGYAHPDPSAVRRDLGAGSVIRCEGRLVFYVELATSGLLSIAIERLAGAPEQRIEASLALHPGAASARVSCDAPSSDKPARVALPAVEIDQAGTWRLELSTSDGRPLEELASLQFGGAAAVGARASTVERRNAASVHLWYEVPAADRDDIEWFYCELTPRTDPLWTYYMAAGWHRGYFGMQVNSKTERRVIFSVWDSGDEAVDRNKVAAADRVQLTAKGHDVHVSGFGNEGTGGHSHLIHDWKLGDTFRFLVRAEPEGSHTVYSGWFWFAERKAWGLIASFKAPADGRFLHGLYSFSENFSGRNGDRLRECDYGNVWVRTRDGRWLPLRTARFTHDGHGDTHRMDRRGGIRDDVSPPAGSSDRFFLRHGNYATPQMPRGFELKLSGPPGESPTTLPNRQ